MIDAEKEKTLDELLEELRKYGYPSLMLMPPDDEWLCSVLDNDDFPIFEKYHPSPRAAVEQCLERCRKSCEQ